jgi:dynein intermediate chain
MKTEARKDRAVTESHSPDRGNRSVASGSSILADDVLKDVQRLLSSAVAQSRLAEAEVHSPVKGPTSTIAHGSSGTPDSKLTEEVAQARAEAAQAAHEAAEIRQQLMQAQKPPPVCYDKSFQAGEEFTAEATEDLRKELEIEREKLQQQEAIIRELQTTHAQEKTEEPEESEADVKEFQAMSSEEATKTIASKSFQNFFSRTSSIIERALGAGASLYDPTVDYSAVDDQAEQQTKEEDILSLRQSFSALELMESVITAIDWHPVHKELLLVAYANVMDEDSTLNSRPHGAVYVWNLHLLDRPEHKFFCDTAVTAAQFHPSDPRLVIGGTEGGRVVLWDLRAGSKPVNTSALTAGHINPIRALVCVPALAGLSIVTASSDGLLCTWSDTNLHSTISQVKLIRPKTEEQNPLNQPEISVSCLSASPVDHSTLTVGTDDGNLYQLRFLEGNIVMSVPNAHHALVSSVHCQPVHTQRGPLSALFLSASFDWTVSLWSSRMMGTKPLFSFQSAGDYVHDVQWSPCNPAVFATGDGQGNLDLWDINHETDVPLFRAHITGNAFGGDTTRKSARAITKLRWAPSGALLAASCADGTLHVFSCATRVHTPASAEDNVSSLQALISKQATAIAAAAATELAESQRETASPTRARRTSSISSMNSPMRMQRSFGSSALNRTPRTSSFSSKGLGSFSSKSREKKIGSPSILSPINAKQY